MSDQIIDAETARVIHMEALQKWPLLAWVIIRDEADFPGKIVAQLVTAAPTRMRSWRYASRTARSAAAELGSIGAPAE